MYLCTYNDTWDGDDLVTIEADDMTEALEILGSWAYRNGKAQGLKGPDALLPCRDMGLLAYQELPDLSAYFQDGLTHGKTQAEAQAAHSAREVAARRVIYERLKAEFEPQACDKKHCECGRNSDT